MGTAADKIQDTYRSIPGQAEGLFKDKGSRFMSLAYPVESEEEVKVIVNGLKKKFHDARHHCYAYRLGCLGDRFRANDDGEPSSSAGKPILGQIDSRGLSDVLVVVVRWFGGIKLGIPGLVKAYRAASADALDKAGTVEKIAGKWYRLSFGYEDMNQVMKALKDLDTRQRSQDFGSECSVEVWARLSAVQDLVSRLENIGGCTLNEL